VKAATVEDALNELDRTPHVYRAICEVQAELAKTGIAKSRNNQQQGYKFRGIDEVYAALSPLLARHSLVIVPRVLDRQMVQLVSAKGSPLYNVTVRAEFDFVSAIDGTTHTAATFGEAMDTADKATNKAMSAAYKYAAFMTFAIPTEGEDNDADASHHEVAVAPQKISPADFERIKELAPKAGKTLADLEAAYKVEGLLNLTAEQGRACIARLEDLAKVAA
jgi:hypothetical protein